MTAFSFKNGDVMMMTSHRADEYDETKCDQLWTVPITHKLLVSVPPIIFIFIALFFLHLTQSMRKGERDKNINCSRKGGRGTLCVILTSIITLKYSYEDLLNYIQQRRW